MYQNQTLINVHTFQLPKDLYKPTHFMDLKNSNHACTPYLQPSTFFEKVQTVEYHNGFYLEKVLTYETTIPVPTISDTWQHRLVNRAKWGSVGILLVYVVKKFLIQA